MALWSAEKLQKVREIISRYHAAIALSVFGVKSLPDDLVKDLRAAGMEIPTGPALIDDAFTYGKLLAILRDPNLATKSPNEVADLVIDRKQDLALTPAEKAALEVARAHAGQYVVGLGTRVAGQVMAAVTGAEANLTPERMVEIIRDKTAGNRARRETIDSLRSDLGHAMGNWTRDWQRIAMTESNNAIQEGTASAIEQRHGTDELVSKIPRPDACPDCKRLYTRGGEPIIFKLSELRANGSNVGRRKADWKPTIEAVHPWCGCVLVRVPAGMVWEEGELRPAKVEKSERLEKAARKLHGRLEFAGMPISIENRRGSYRHWYDPVAKEHGKTKVLHPYGYIRLTEGTDGDHVDCYIGPDKHATRVYVVHQQKKHPDGSFGGYDEDKAMLGFPSASAAKAAYLAHYNDPRFFGSMTTMTVAEFKAKLVSKRGEKLTKARPTPATPTPLFLKLEKSYAPCPRCGEMMKESSSDADEPCWTCRKQLEAAGTPYVRARVLEKGGPYIGPRGGKWADPEHTVPWKDAIESLPHLEDEKWDDGTVVRWRQSPFTPARAKEKPQLPSRTATTIEHVPLDKLHATQSRVTEEGVRKYQDKPLRLDDDHLDLPLITIDKNGKHFIQDGHHRLTAAKLRGETTTPVRVQRESPAALAHDHEPKVGETHEIHAKGMYPFTAKVVAADDDTVTVGQGADATHGVKMPKASFAHFVNDLRGVVHGPPSDNPLVDAVVGGRAEYLGKGDDGVAFRVGSKVVKASTTVPYQPFNPGHLTPEAASARMEEQARTNNAMADDGVPGIMRVEIAKHAGKTFQIKPYAEIPQQLTREQLDSVAESVRKAHEKGWIFGDEIQVGIHDGKLVHFDTGKAQRYSPDEKTHAGNDRRGDDINALKRLFAQHGEKYLTDEEKADPSEAWEDLMAADPSKMDEAKLKDHTSALLRHSFKIKAFIRDNPDKLIYDVGMIDEDMRAAMGKAKAAKEKLAKGLDDASGALAEVANGPSRIGMMSWRGNEEAPRPQRPADLTGANEEAGLTVKGKKKRRKARAEAAENARVSRMAPEERFAPAKRIRRPAKRVQQFTPETLADAREGARDGAETKREAIRADLERRVENKPPRDPVRIARARGES